MARLPPIATLRAVEAAVRHKSYSKAARELNLTHGAISHQLRRLESDLGVTLFRRAGNDMLPTPAAERLAASLAASFTDMERALQAAGVADQREHLVLSVETSFASRWLAPRFQRLSAASLDLDLRVEDRVADFVRDGVDVAIRIGGGPWPGVENALIFGETLFVVCSPAFASRHAIVEPKDLLAAPLLRPAFGAWADWFAIHGLETPDADELPIDRSALMIDAAVQGLGAALARSGLVEQDLKDGRLVRPVAGEVDAGAGYHLVWRADSRKLSRIAALLAWLVAEVADGT
jgi:LysR family glycine cleavage system transcriptional activator